MHIYNNLSRTQILFGNSQENEVGRQVKYCGGSRILLVYFNLHNHLDSLLDKIRRSLKNAGLDVCELSCKNRVADMDTIFDGIKLCQTNRVDFVLCVGDITSFAVAKTICAGAPYTENVYEIFKAQTEIFQTLPLGIVSTTVCGGKAFTNYATVSHTLSDGSLTFYSLSSDLLLPRFAIFSPELCRYDALSVEYSVSRVLYLLFFRYFLKNKAVELSDRITLASIKTVLLMYRRHKLNSADLDSITELMWASINANINPLYDLSKDDGLSEIINGIL
ncbi:MAG: iron-containing alcohol dehydrogenase, partial [Succinivibrio sp.]